MSDDVGGAGDRLAEKGAGYLILLLVLLVCFIFVVHSLSVWSRGFLP